MPHAVPGSLRSAFLQKDVPALPGPIEEGGAGRRPRADGLVHRQQAQESAGVATEDIELGVRPDVARGDVTCDLLCIAKERRLVEQCARVCQRVDDRAASHATADPPSLHGIDPAGCKRSAQGRQRF